MRWLSILTVLFALALAVSGAQAQELGPGDPAPPFSLPGSDGNTHSLTQYSGQTVVIAWFPKAFTGG